ncbi:Phenylacetate-coenzyme A ligase PaaK, adenylate-forming domain family [Streptomyces sp. 1222.5]|uniref:acyl-CoA reductase n=1 Tax=unclassified Streptomyces TaxID=2593676 RepID=UPI000896FCC0|nr:MULTISPECIES: acyl-CoA reductase [unclassified Streptomyces]PKW11091.1 phenylacetate-coenzyme A ligase PaaK-like adenylate-forming protein [Streptomyces sp. 5112.2]SEB88380.1 Phenylacetate-coenzyme A ligase PaaK, adenylate-forming domain family [Streptomyces sp. 1222.5]
MTAVLHLWQGEFVDDAEAGRRLAGLSERAGRVLARPLPTDVVLDACAAVGGRLADPASDLYGRLAGHLPAGEAAGVLAELATALTRQALERKLRRELGGLRPERLTRPDARETVYESWAPVGLLVHIAPSNAAAVAPLSVVEGLLAGNLNVLKTSSADSGLAAELLTALGAADPGGLIAERVVVLRFASSRRDWLRTLCGQADAIAVWGGEDAVRAVGELAPPGCRVVEWGHRISFAYLTPGAAADDALLDALAADVCRFEQQACSSPQVVYLDTGDTEELFAFAARFAERLAKVSDARPAPLPGTAEQAEISTVQQLARLEQHLGLTRVFAAEDGSWRVLADTRPALDASPLHRSVWVKPLPRAALVATLRPMRRYLQTAAVGGDRSDLAALSRALLAAGVTRVTPVGSMLDGYEGEPHDGVYALQRYSRRVGVRAPGADFGDVACLDDLVAPPVLPPAPDAPLLGKEGVQRALATLDPRHAHLYFRSGGSTGAPALSVFTCDDYDNQMRAAAHGLLTAGFDPARDRAANLFYCGGMYGSFISFFSILERLDATQIPMAAGPDHALVAEALVAHRVDTVFGMPSYLWQLFHAEADRLRAYGGVKKVFYGGEHFTAEQRQVLHEEFGVETIRSAAYGSTDLGPLGYQCTACEGSVHHVLTDLHTLEILDPLQDRPVAPGEPGRLVFTSRARSGQRLERYEIGDLGRAVEGPCACGSHVPRLELLGRHGDVVRVGTYFVNYRRVLRAAQERLAYHGEVQLLVAPGTGRELLTVRLDEQYAGDAAAAREALAAEVPELAAAEAEGLLAVAVETVPRAAFARTATSGKLRTVVDLR